MRILHLTDNYSPVYGGLERSVQTLAGAQIKRGHTLAVVTAARAGLPRHQVEEGVTVHRIPFALQHLPGAFAEAERRVFFPPAVDPFFARAFSRILRSFKPDVIHSHGWIYFSAARAADQSGAGIIATAHDYGAACALKSLFPQGAICDGPGLSKCVRCAYRHYGPKGVAVAGGLRYASRMNRYIDHWTGLSSAVALAGSAPRPSDRQNMEVIPSYVPDSVMEVEKYRQRPAFVPPSGPYIFFAGALNKSKGVEVLLDAYDRLSDAADVPLVLAGVPEPGLTIRKKGVTVEHSVPHDQVMAGWVNAAVGVIPSIWPEPFGQVAVECLASGTPTIVSRVGGLGDIVEDDVSGLVIPPGDAEALAGAMHRILADKAVAARLSKEGPLRARQFTVSAVLPQIERAYETAIRTRKSRTERSGPDGLVPA